MKPLILFLCVLLLFSLNGCTYKESKQNKVLPPETVHIQEELSSTTQSTIEETSSIFETIQQDTELPYIFQFSETPNSDLLKEGQLIHTVLDMHIIKDINDFALEGKFADFGSVCIYSDNGEETIYHYPDFVDETGRFLDDIELLLLTISIESFNAHHWTSADINENPYVGGMYSDPYIFRIDGIYSLQKDFGSGFSAGDYPAFFSEMDSVDEHPFAYRLEPGNETVVTIGFLIGDNPVTGKHLDYSNMRIRIPGGGGSEFFIDLSEDFLSFSPKL